MSDDVDLDAVKYSGADMVISEQEERDREWMARYMSTEMLPPGPTWDDAGSDPLGDMREFIRREKERWGTPLEREPVAVHPDVHQAIKGLAAGPVILDEVADFVIDWRAVPVLPKKSLLALCLEV